jgi:hypothetical protein
MASFIHSKLFIAKLLIPGACCQESCKPSWLYTLGGGVAFHDITWVDTQLDCATKSDLLDKTTDPSYPPRNSNPKKN